MARITEPSEKMTRAWNEWVSSRPAAVRAVAERFDPWSLYRLTSTGQRVPIVSFGESPGDCPITLTVSVSGRFNFTIPDLQVFGIDPDDLEPCDLPGPDELVAVAFSGTEGC